MRRNHVFRLADSKGLVQPVLQLLWDDVASMLVAVHDPVAGPAERLDAGGPYVMGVHLFLISRKITEK
jgi:hypothetical protein